VKDHFLHLFEYNDWANSLVLKVISDKQISDQKIFLLFSHTIIAQILWLNRVNLEDNEFKDFWQLLSREEMNELSRRSTNDWKSFIKSKQEVDLQSEVSYVNSKGNPYKNTLAQIMTHVINHSTYHRAQIASRLRAEKINPPLTDYIAFFR
jgi:uncharacterized damage-inducible protein DinB